MAAIRNAKPDATGRSSRKSKRGKLEGPPKDAPWTWQSIEMMRSLAWRRLSANARRVIDFLQIEHIRHGGYENGILKAPYDQLEEHGIRRGTINKAITEAQLAGFIDVVRGGRSMEGDKSSLFRLTWLPDLDGNPPTNRWRFISAKLANENSQGDKNDTLEAPTK